MKKILIILLFCSPLLFTSPVRSQVSVQIDIGNPAVRPWPDGIWVPGYYVIQPETHRRVWVAGKWKHDNGHHYGQYKNKERGHGNGHGNGHGRGK